MPENQYITAIIDICQWMDDDGWHCMRQVADAAIRANASGDINPVREALKRAKKGLNAGPMKESAAYIRELERNLEMFRSDRRDRKAWGTKRDTRKRPETGKKGQPRIRRDARVKKGR